MHPPDQGLAEMPVLRFSTEQFAARERIPAWREFVGRTFCRAEIEPLSREGFVGRTTMRLLPGLGVISGDCAPLSYVQTRQLSDNDDVILTFASGPWQLDYRGRIQACGAGDAILTSASCLATHTLHAGGPHGGLRVPIKLLSPLVDGIEDTFGKRIAAQAPAMRLLRHHLGMVEELEAPDMHGLRAQAASQLRDLIAMAIGPTRDGSEMARSNGVRAARLRAIKRDIRQNVRQDLSVAVLAARHRLPVRSLQRLFEAEGTTLTDFVVAERLACAHAMLTQRFADRPVSTIAFDCGFQHVSYFNRAFRLRYGATPSDVRAQARRSH